MRTRFSWNFSSRPAFGGPAMFTTFAAGEEGGGRAPRLRLGAPVPLTTLAIGEEGGRAPGRAPRGAVPLTTLAIGEEGGGPRPMAILPLVPMRLGRWG